MNVNLNTLLDPIKSEFDQCSSVKSFWKKLHDLYSKKHASQDEDDDYDYDSDEE